MDVAHRLGLVDFSPGRVSPNVWRDAARDGLLVAPYRTYLQGWI